MGIYRSTPAQEKQDLEYGDDGLVSFVACGMQGKSFARARVFTLSRLES